jgi:hypothetical protein
MISTLPEMEMGGLLGGTGLTGWLVIGWLVIG